MDAWSKVGPASNLNLKGKRGEKMGFFLQFLANSGSGYRSELEREIRKNFHLLSTIYGDRVVGIH